MSKRTVQVTLLVVAILLLSGCALPGVLSIAGSGNIVTEAYDYSGFDSVEVSSAFAVDLIQSDTYKVVIDIDDNFVQYLDVKVLGDTLQIGLRPGQIYGLSRTTLRAQVTMPELSELRMSGASHGTVSGFESTSPFTADLSGASSLRGDISAGDVRFEASGASHVTLGGRGDDAHIEVSGASSVDLGDFPTASADVDASGASRATVNTNGRLDADASGASTITYVGNPTMGRIDTSGASSIKAQ